MAVGMIDWLTLIIDMSHLSPDVRQYCHDNLDRVQRISPDGEIRWESPVIETIRSDSHQVTVKFGSTLMICGSPARVIDVNNVFGSLDIKGCASQMIFYVMSSLQLLLPCDLKLWRCTKIDVTQNFDLGTPAAVQEAIDYFKPLKIGRQKTTTYDTSVNWGQSSNLHMGKIYAKGVHARKLQAKGRAHYTDEQLKKCDRLLRIEYSIRRLFIKRIHETSGYHWHEFTPEMLIAFHSQYFGKFLSSAEVVDMDNVLELLKSNVGKAADKIPTEGQAVAAYDCYVRCKMNGLSKARSSYTKPSWHRHLHNLRTIGIIEADLQQQNVVSFRRRPIMLDKPVSSWDDIPLQARL